MLLSSYIPMSLIKPWPQETTGGPPSPPPRRLNPATGDGADDGVACTAMCLAFPRFSKKKRPSVKPTRKSARKAWWPWSPPLATFSGDAAAAKTLTPQDDDDGDGSASFKHWGQPESRSQQSSSRVAPRASSSSSTSFSFPSSPASASSFMSTPKLGPGR
ncbi:unnamed protein product [Urochloa decumbens]|uniref:Uncharacterized protein n=1 Tax=Urochloa decumbens TaxID=240449 RepID=A0ABC9A5G1_9POAL